jgi:hypothetical protein
MRMDVIIETRKRMDLAQTITTPLKGIVEGVMLGGSMGFGQNYSVTEKSDIDLVIVCDKNYIDKLAQTPYFQSHIPYEVLTSFKQSKLNCFWVSRVLHDIEVNAFIYEPESYAQFCQLKGKLTIYSQKRPSETQTGYGFSGEILHFKRNVKSFLQGNIYEKPALVEQKYWGGVPRQDFFYSGQILYERQSFLTQLEQEVWKTTMLQLRKEYGSHPDLDKYNVLNTHWTYQRAQERLPQQVIERIRRRTQEELDKLLQ